jgi:hypothetical protein
MLALQQLQLVAYYSELDSAPILSSSSSTCCHHLKPLAPTCFNHLVGCFFHSNLVGCYFQQIILLSSPSKQRVTRCASLRIPR